MACIPETWLSTSKALGHPAPFGYLTERGPEDPAISVVIYVDSHYPAVAAFTFWQAQYEAGLKTFAGSHHDAEYDQWVLSGSCGGKLEGTVP